MKWTFDYKPIDIFWCTADVGWVTGHTYIAYGPLAVGATEIVFEGVPTYPDAGRFWKMIQDHKVTVFYTAPTAIRSLIKAGADLPKKYDLSSLRMLGTVGEPINPGSVDVVLQDGRRRPLPDRRYLVADRDRRPPDHAAAGRDAAEAGFVHAAAAGHHRRHRRRDRASRRERQGRHPGDQAAVAVDDPHHLGRSGALSRRATTRRTSRASITSPATARARDQEGYFRIMGRIDDVLNVSGHRLGTMEIESALVANSKLVAEAAVVGRPDDLTGEAVCAFVVLKGARPTGDDAQKIAKELRDWVAKEIGPIAKPKDIRFGDNLPKTRSGKIMRRLLRSIAKGEEITQDVSTLENPAILEQLKQAT